MLETNGTFYVTPLQTSRLAIVRLEVNFCSRFLDSIRGTFTAIELPQQTKTELKTTQAWFTIDFFNSI